MALAVDKRLTFSNTGDRSSISIYIYSEIWFYQRTRVNWDELNTTLVFQSVFCIKYWHRQAVCNVRLWVFPLVLHQIKLKCGVFIIFNFIKFGRISFSLGKFWNYSWYSLDNWPSKCTKKYILAIKCGTKPGKSRGESFSISFSEMESGPLSWLIVIWWWPS